MDVRGRGGARHADARADAVGRVAVLTRPAVVRDGVAGRRPGVGARVGTGVRPGVGARVVARCGIDGAGIGATGVDLPRVDPARIEPTGVEPARVEAALDAEPLERHRRAGGQSDVTSHAKRPDGTSNSQPTTSATTHTEKSTERIRTSPRRRSIPGPTRTETRSASPLVPGMNAHQTGRDGGSADGKEHDAAGQERGPTIFVGLLSVLPARTGRGILDRRAVGDADAEEDRAGDEDGAAAPDEDPRSEACAVARRGGHCAFTRLVGGHRRAVFRALLLRLQSASSPCGAELRSGSRRGPGSRRPAGASSTPRTRVGRRRPGVSAPLRSRYCRGAAVDRSARSCAGSSRAPPRSDRRRRTSRPHRRRARLGVARWIAALGGSRAHEPEGQRESQ